MDERVLIDAHSTTETNGINEVLEGEGSKTEIMGEIRANLEEVYTKFEEKTFDWQRKEDLFKKELERMKTKTEIKNKNLLQRNYDLAQQVEMKQVVNNQLMLVLAKKDKVADTTMVDKLQAKITELKEANDLLKNQKDKPDLETEYKIKETTSSTKK